VKPNSEGDTPEQEAKEPSISQAHQSVSEPQHPNNNPNRKFDWGRIWSRVKAGFRNIFAPLSVMDSVGYFTAVLAFVAGLQWFTLEKTDETLNRTLQLTQRPWIDVSAEIDGPLEWNNDGFVVPFKIVSKNTGYAPATNLFVTIRPVSIQKQPFYAAEIIRENCDTSSALGKNSFGKVVFRDGISIQRFRSSVSNSEFGGQIVPPFVILCAAYAFSLAHEGAKTVILYQLFRSDPAHPGAGFTIERKDGNVPVENLRLFNFGSRAD